MLSPEIPCGARAIFDDNGLSPTFTQTVTKYASKNIGSAPWRGADYYANRLGGKGLRVADLAGDQAGAASSAAHVVEVISRRIACMTDVFKGSLVRM